LEGLYQNTPEQLGSFEAFIQLRKKKPYVIDGQVKQSILETPKQIDAISVKTEVDLFEYVFEELLLLMGNYYELIYFDGVEYDVEDLKDIDTAEPIIKEFLLLQPITSQSNTQPILNINAPSIQGTYNTYEDKDDPTGKLCIFKELTHMYNEEMMVGDCSSKVRKKKKTIEDLLKMTIDKGGKIPLERTDANGNVMYNGVIPIEEELTIDNIKQNGGNLEMLILLSDALNIPLNVYEEVYTTDKGFKLHLDRYGDTNKKRKALNVLLENNHIYRFTTEALILHKTQFVNQSREVIKRDTHAKAKVKKEYEIVLNPYKSSYECIMKYTPTKVKIKNGDFTDYTYEGKKFILHPMKEMIEEYGDKYTGQTPQSVAYEYTQHIPRTTMTEEIFNALTAENVKHRTHADTIKPEYFKNGMPTYKNIKKYDLNKAYAYVMENMTHFNDLDITQTIIECSTLQGDGFYFTTSKDISLFHGDNWYSLEFLQYAKEQGINFRIKAYIKTLKKPIDLKECFDKIDEEIHNCDTAKLIKNSVSGLFGITESKTITGRITTSHQKVFDFYTKETKPYIKKEGELFIYGHKDITKSYTNRLLIYLQILDEFNILLHKRIKDSGGELIARHIDAFYVLNPTNTDHLSNKKGDYKEEVFKPQHPHNKERDRNVIYKHIEPKGTYKILDGEDLTIEDLKDGAILDGRAGTGKTTAINRLKLNALFVAPTHTASNHYEGGQTIHKFFNIDEDDKANYPNMKEEYLVIDEASMITSDLWFHIINFKRINPNVKLIILGDRHQLPSIEENTYDFNTTKAILDLVNHNVIELGKVYRQDDEGSKISQQLIDGEDVEFNISSGYYKDGVNICFLNKTRQTINRHLNEKKGISILLNDYNEEEEQLSGYLYKGCKVICNKTIKGLCFNGQSEIVMYCKDDNIYLQSGKVISYSDFSRHYTLAYAITIYKAQGATYEAVNIYDLGIMKKSYRMIYTAISRAKDFSKCRFIY
jgi:hypothetical protein